MTDDTDNELICEHLLRWERATPPAGFIQSEHFKWLRPYPFGLGKIYDVTPDFSTWAHAGLLLDAMQADPSLAPACARLGVLMSLGVLTPQAIRAEAVQWARERAPHEG